MRLGLGSYFFDWNIGVPGNLPRRAIVNEYAAGGGRLAIENHDRLHSGTLAWVFEQLRTANVGVRLDMMNSFGASKVPTMAVALLECYTPCLHAGEVTIRRMSHSRGLVPDGCPAGAEKLDLRWLREQLVMNPHPFNVALEAWVTPHTTLTETMAARAGLGGTGHPPSSRPDTGLRILAF